MLNCMAAQHAAERAAAKLHALEASVAALATAAPRPRQASAARTTGQGDGQVPIAAERGHAC